VTATIGVAAAPQDGNSVELLTSHADLALYSGKNSGRNRVCVYEAAMSAEEAYQRFVERELREAIFFNQLCLHYQPVFALDGNAPAAYEALVRWNHPFRGMISPSVFIPVAERSTLIDMIGEWVIRQACRDAKRLGGLPISVNVSPAQLRRAGFVDTILAILASEGASPGTFVLEVTETVEMRGGEVEIRNLAALRAAGFRIAIDDFGAGFTSLEYLKRFPFAAIKIDKGYIANIARNTVDLALVTAIAGIGRALDVRVIAEGVETEEQRQAVQKAGCTHIQGYLVGRPAPLVELERVRASDLSALGRLLTTEAA
jgi:EAL domain-containing protein (putative c-di-GMP-specific phosphodiesterase class I)